MAGKSKAERKKNRQRTEALKAREENAPIAHQVEHGVKAGEIDAVAPVMVKVKKVETTVNGRPVFKDAEKVEALRRRLDTELFDMVADVICREDALMEIQGAWERRTRGTGMSAFDPTRAHMPKGRGEDGAIVQFNIDLEKRYADWIRLCESREIVWTVVTDHFCIGTSKRVIEHTARKRNGWANGEIIKAADVWCELRGWKKRERAA